MEHPRKNDLPLSFDRHLRSVCPAIFRLSEHHLSGMRHDFEPGHEPGDADANEYLSQGKHRHNRMDPSFEPGNEPGDAMGNRFLNQHYANVSAQEQRDKIKVMMNDLSLNALIKLERMVRGLL